MPSVVHTAYLTSPCPPVQPPFMPWSSSSSLLQPHWPFYSLKTTKLLPTSGPLHLPCPLLGTSLPRSHRAGSLLLIPEVSIQMLHTQRGPLRVPQLTVSHTGHHTPTLQCVLLCSVKNGLVRPRILPLSHENRTCPCVLFITTGLVPRAVPGTCRYLLNRRTN